MLLGKRKMPDEAPLVCLWVDTSTTESSDEHEHEHATDMQGKKRIELEGIHFEKLIDPQRD